MCDRIDNNDNQDPIQKIFRQLSELASSQQSGHSSTSGIEGGGQWTQFSGIPSHPGQTSFPWNHLTVSDTSNAEPLRNGNLHAVYNTNDSLRETVPSLHNGSSQQVHSPWQTDSVSSSHQAFQRSDSFRTGFFDVPSHPCESHVTGYNANSRSFQHHVSSNPVGRFTFSGDNLSGSSEPFRPAGHSDLNQVHQSFSLFPSSHFDSASYSPPQSPSSISTGSPSHGHIEGNLQTSHFAHASYGFPRKSSSTTTCQTPGPLEGNFQTFMSHAHGSSIGLQGSPTFDSPAVSSSKKSSLGTRSLSHDPSLDTFDSHQLERRTSHCLDLGFNVEKQSLLTKTETIPVADGREIYKDSLSKWHSFDSPEISCTIGCDFNHSTQSTVSEPDPSKPSYSDIAKTPKSVTSISKQDQSLCDNIQKNQSSRIKRKDIKAPRPFARQTSSGSKSRFRRASGGIAEKPKMPSNSRYGLDSFDDVLLNGRNQNSKSEIHTDLVRNRKETESSSGSGICVDDLDDIPSGMSRQHVTSGGDASAHTMSDRKGEKTPGCRSGIASSTDNGVNPTYPQNQDKRDEQNLFFDPRRIFQNKSTNKLTGAHPSSSSSSKPSGSKTAEQAHTLLNNGKPSASASFSKLPTTARKHDYINNDLRENSKLTNQDAAEIPSPVSNETDSLPRQKESKPRSGKRFSSRPNSSSHRERKKSPDKRTQTPGGGNYEYNENRGIFWSHVDMEKIEEWCDRASKKFKCLASWLITIMVNLFLTAMGLIIYVSSLAVSLIFLYVGKCSSFLKGKVFGKNDMRDNPADWRSQDFMKRRVGLEDNIVLPSTGDDAMKRLLSCKGEDPYSILGVKADSSDEDIKRYYRKQAVLVHPDKNQEPGAEEAFKVLGHAFEMIGDPVKRKQYDSHSHAQEKFDDVEMRAFAEMLSRLHAKIQEAANIMPCDHCGGKHRRIPVNREFYCARYCGGCNTRHAAKEGDVWAETAMFGFLWHYYALMEGRVYEITEWMKCHQELFRHMKANDHAVGTRISNGGNRKPRYRNAPDPTVEDLINHLFNPSDPWASQQSPGSPPPHSGADPGWGQARPGAATGACGKKSGRRNRKKRS